MNVTLCAADPASGISVLNVSGDLCTCERDTEHTRILNFLRTQVSLSDRMIVNLTDVKQIDSVGVCALTRALVECAKQQIEVNIVVPGGVPGKVLNLLHVLDPWSTFPDEAAAAQAFLT